ncbi:MAG: hypothetical protein O3B65_01200 [Chloroflexi bacterium]|nr:hypothetical protein [Chloroflexota bacterium]
MVREAKSQTDQTVDAPPDFLGREYNLTIWKPTRTERDYFRNEGPRVGALAPDFTLPSIDGSVLNLESLRGTPVVLEIGSMT